MLEAVMATYNGDNVFILDEAASFAQGQRVMIVAIEPKHMERPKRIDLHRFSGSAGNLFGSVERADEYVKGLRENDRI